MTDEECTAILAPFVLALRADFDEPTFMAYHQMLGGLSPRLLRDTLHALQGTGLRFMPTAPEVLAAAETERRRQVAARPYAGCVRCEQAKGWIEERDPATGSTRAQRCPCWQEYQDALTRDGLLMPVAQLPRARTFDDDRALPAPTL